MLEILQPYITEILDALKTAIIGAITLGGALVLAWMRAKFQARIANEAVVAVEKKAFAQTSAGGGKVDGAVKKKSALSMTAQNLPWHAQPLLPGGMDRLVERQAKALKRASEPPPEAG